MGLPKEFFLTDWLPFLIIFQETVEIGTGDFGEWREGNKGK